MITLPIFGFVFALIGSVACGAILLLMGILLQEQRQEFAKARAEFEVQKERVEAKLAAGGRRTSGRIV